MSLKEKMQADLLEATRNKDEIRRSTLRLLKSSILNAEKGKRRILSDEEVVEVLFREIKSRKESIAEFRKGNRADLVDREEAELAVVQSYMPQQMSREEITRAAQQVIGEIGAEGPSDTGKVMGRLMPQLRGKADGKEVNEVVAELLSA
ncbi:MAG: GatB/YqeY domain-containing protein, partial [Dehalococcoidia bacterium]